MNSRIITVGVVILRACLLWSFFQRNSGIILVVGVGEAFALVSTLRGVVAEDLDERWTGALVPLCYCVPMLFSSDATIHPQLFVVLLLVAITAGQLCLRVYMGWSLTVGSPMLVRLISTGPYRLVRHPLATIEILMVFLCALAVPSRYNLAVGALSVCAVALSILAEERHLKRFDSYRRYMLRTKGAILPQW